MSFDGGTLACDLGCSFDTLGCCGNFAPTVTNIAANDSTPVDLGGGVKSLGEHDVRILLHSNVTAIVKLTVEAEE